MLKQMNLYLKMLIAVMMMAIGGSVWAETVTDVLNQSLTGVTGTLYSSFSGKKGVSSAVYAGTCAGGRSSIQLRTSSNAGVITTESGGKVRRIVVTWEPGTTNKRVLDVYGKNSAYSGVSELFSSRSATQGKLLGQITYGTSTTLDIEGDYAFIGFRSHDGALYLSEVRIDWEGDGSVDTPSETATTTAFPQASYTATLGAVFMSPTATVFAGGVEVEGAAVSYSSGDEEVATIDSSTGEVTLVAAGETTITATYAGDETHDASSGSYTLTVKAEMFSTTWVVEDAGYADKEALDGAEVVRGNVSLLLSCGGVSYRPYYDASRKAVHFYNKNQLIVSAVEGYAITKIDLTYGTSITFGANVGTMSKIVGKCSSWTGCSPFVVLTNGGGGYGELVGVSVGYVKLTDTERMVEVGSVGYGTFCSDIPVIVGDGRSSSIIVGAEGGVLVQEGIGVIPAGEGVLLTGANTYKLYTYGGLTPAVPTTNYLKGVLTDTLAEEGWYVLQQHEDVVAFYEVGDTKPTVTAGKAYLDMMDASAKVRAFCFTMEDAYTTAVQRVAIGSDEIEAVYTLGGVKVNSLQRGMNIVRLKNGRKVKSFCHEDGRK